MGDNPYVVVAGYEFSQDEARSIIAGYALGRTEAIELKAVGTCKELEHRNFDYPRWGYRTYDCILSSPGSACEPVDYLVVSGLNGQIDVSAVAALQEACPLAFAELSRVDEDVYFWELDAHRLSAFPEERCPERHLWRAWCHMMTMPQLGVALTHKTLHHKRPRLFPLIDGQTVGSLGDHAWRTIHTDLNQEEGKPFEELETWFADLVRDQADCVPLSRLRLHDILLWCRIIPGQQDEAISKGKKFL